MRLALVVCALFVFSVQVFAQDSPAYGQPSDLKGLKKVFVDTGADTDSRNSIMAELEKTKLGFEIVDDASSAEIILGFGASTGVRRVVATRTNSDIGSTTSVQEVRRRTGTGEVYAYARGKTRLIYSFDEMQKTIFSHKPVSNFVKEFIKIYKKGQ